MRLISFGIRLYKLFLADKKKYLYVPLGVYWIVIFILTTIPGKSLPKIAGSDKLKHFGAYFVLGFLLDFALYLQNKYPFLSKRTPVFTFIIGLLYGLFDELHQIFIPGRYFEWWDLFADGVGIVLGIILSQIIIMKTSNNNFVEGD